MKLHVGYWLHCIFTDASWPAERKKVAADIAGELAQLFAFAADVIGRKKFTDLVQKEVVEPALILNERLEASPSYWFCGNKPLEDVRDDLDQNDGAGLLEALESYKFENIAANNKKFDWEREAPKMGQNPDAPSKAWLLPQLRILSNVAPDLCVVPPAADGLNFEPDLTIVVRQHLLVSFPLPGLARTDGAGDTDEISTLLLAP